MVVCVEKGTDPYADPVTNEVCATSAESAEMRVRLGTPGSGHDFSSAPEPSYSVAPNDVTVPGSVCRHIRSRCVAYTQSHGSEVTVRRPDGSLSGTEATSP